MVFHNNWRTFLQEDDIEEATAAKKRGIELPSVMEELEKYSKPITELPTHYIQFSSINKLGINPSSHYNTPLGIYSYPVNDVILDELKKGTLPFASDREFIILFKPRKGSNIIYNVPSSQGNLSEHEFNLIDYQDALLKIFSPALIKKMTKDTHRSDQKVYNSYETFKASLERGSIDSPMLAAMDLNFLLSEHDNNYFLESHFSDPVLKDAIEEIKKYNGWKSNPLGHSKKDYFTKMILHYTRLAMRRGGNIEYMTPDEMEEKLGLDDDDRLVGYDYQTGHGNFVRQPKINNNHIKAIQEAYKFLLDLAAQRDGHQQLVINYSWKYIPKEEIKKHWNIRSGKMEKIDIIQKTEAVSTAIKEAKKRHWLGIIWNITRNIAADMKKWSTLWRSIGVDGISDYAGDAMIHESEPMQAVFFSRYAVDQVATFDNKLTPEKVTTRGKMQYARVVIPAIKNEFRELLNRVPNKRELDWVLQLFGDYTKGENVSEEDILNLINVRKKLSRKGTEYAIGSAVFRDKKFALIDIIDDLRNKIEDKSEQDKDVDNITNSMMGGFDALGVEDPKEVEDFRYHWNRMTLEYEHNLDDPLRSGLYIKNIEIWFDKTKQLWDEHIKPAFNIEFPYKRL